MKRSSITLFVAAIVLLAAVIVWLRANRPTTGGTGGTNPQTQVITRTAIRPTPDKPSEPPASASGSPESSPKSRESIMEEIRDAALTYDAKALPRIRPYLLNSDPDIREAAINGMITLGDASAGPMLREAARQTTDPREAARLLDAADYVELPSGTPLLKKRRAAGPK